MFLFHPYFIIIVLSNMKERGVSFYKVRIMVGEIYCYVFILYILLNFKF